MADLERPQLRRVINATGVLLHTNLGRARLSRSAADAVSRAATEAVALEMDLVTGKRSSRNDRVRAWLRLLTGAGDGLVVNNGAAALWLAVRVLARRGRSVLVSRGEQVAIGGSFRMPELLRTTGARMVDVGTTNRTSIRDYAAELGEGDLVLKVHPSNYRIEGYHEEVSLEELAELCRERDALLVYDAGSGSLLDYRRFGLEGEEPVSHSLSAGADVVTFSGDKLLGGPQAGLAVGREDAILAMARHPIMRALRCDKMVLAAMEETLCTYARAAGDRAPDLPLFHQLSTSRSKLRRRAREMAAELEPRCPRGWSVRAVRSEGAVGGGSFAEHPLPGWEVRLQASSDEEAEALHRELRRGEPAVLARVRGPAIGLDMRTVFEEDGPELCRRVGEAWGVMGTADEPRRGRKGGRT